MHMHGSSASPTAQPPHLLGTAAEGHEGRSLGGLRGLVHKHCGKGLALEHL